MLQANSSGVVWYLAAKLARVAPAGTLTMGAGTTWIEPGTAAGLS